MDARKGVFELSFIKKEIINLDAKIAMYQKILEDATIKPTQKSYPRYNNITQ